MNPTPEDLARDLAADLAWVTEGPALGGWVLLAELRAVALAGLRRALAAEAEVEKLKGLLKGLVDRVATQSELLSARSEKGGMTGWEREAIAAREREEARKRAE